jgi:tRNA threonylcarbamoyladenosine biosynthesis protein TsaE
MARIHRADGIPKRPRVPVPTLTLPDEAATLALGAAIAPLLVPGLVVTLRGELGAGKTTLVRGLLLALGHAGRVKSPTYALVEVYEVSRLHLYHFDFYRFQDPSEWIHAGFRDTFNGQNICLIEWPERAEGQLPSPDLEILLAVTEPGRIATLKASSPAGERLFAGLQPG